MMVMMTAMTPSLNASNLPSPMRAHLPDTAQDGPSSSALKPVAALQSR